MCVLMWYGPTLPLSQCSFRLSGDREPSERDMATFSELGWEYTRSESGLSEQYPFLLGVRVFERLVYCRQ